MQTSETNLRQEQAGGQLWLRPQKSGTLHSLLHLVTLPEVRELREALLNSELPPDLEDKLARLAHGSLAERFIEQNCRLFITLLLAAQSGAFTKANPEARDKLLRALAYVRKDDDAIPDYLPGGFADDQQEVRTVAVELHPLLENFKAWRLRHQVPYLWASKQ